MSGNLVTVLPMGSFVGVMAINATTPPVDVRGFRTGAFTLQLDGFMGVGLPVPTILSVIIQSSNDGINWYTCANQFSAGPINCTGGAVNQTYTAFVDDLGAVVRLLLSAMDPGNGFLGFRIGVQACLKSA